ncbi:reverse transcriptase domain-containing protein [Tanacetum coccineum]
MLADIQETFDKLLEINMKLNPRKCSFDVKDGPFLGYLLTKQGIKANPSKVKAISDLKPPKMVKEIQSLNEKLAALSRFLPEGTDTTLHFLKVLKNYSNKKIVQWTQEAEEAFQKMKEYIETLPTVTALIKGKTLIPTTKRKEKETQNVRNKELDPEYTWRLYTDGASSSDGSGVGLILINPKRREYTYTLRFKFETTNNKSEYEALLAGL